MKLISFRFQGRPTFGVVIDNNGVVDLMPRLARQNLVTLREALAADALKPALWRGVLPDAFLSEVTLLPPIPDPDKIICVGLNYEAHRIETGREEIPVTLGFGVGASFGRQKPVTANLTSGYRTDGQQTFFTYNAGSVADGRNWRVCNWAYGADWRCGRGWRDGRLHRESGRVPRGAERGR